MQRIIADKTSVKEILASNQMKRADDLTQLLAEVIAFDKKRVMRWLQMQSAITGENNPVFLACRMG